MPTTHSTPSESTASELVNLHYGVYPASVERFRTGLHHYVYDCVMPDGSSVVVRATMPSERTAMEGAYLLNKKLRPMGIPLPEIFFHNLNFEFPYLILERLHGEDIGRVLAKMSEENQDRIAARLMAMQRIVGQTETVGKFGYSSAPELAPHSDWVSELHSSLARSRSRIEKAKVFDINVISQVEAKLNELTRELLEQVAVPFLHDITTKNVIIQNGELSGIVDVDSLCFGDPLFQIGLTQMALMSDCGRLDYIGFLLKHYGNHRREHLLLYTAICCVDFMSEIGQEFNGLNSGYSNARKTHLENTFSKVIGNFV